LGLFTVLAIILGIWGVIALVRGRAEAQAHGRTDAQGGRADTQTSGRADTRTSGRADDDAIDYDELRRAEEEVRDLDVNARPEDGFEGDDWGPGAANRH
jgi:hypothetical protein